MAGAIPPEVLVSIDGPAGMAELRRARGVTNVYLSWVDPTDEALGEIAGLPGLRSLSLGGLRPDGRQFAILARLPPGASVKVSGAEDDDPEWAAFRRRRAAQVARLAPEERRRAATRFARGINDKSGYVDGIRSLRIVDGNARDDDLRLLRWLPGLRELEFFRAWGLTSASFRHLSRLERLRSLDIGGVRFTTGSLRPLAGSPGLERLRIRPDDGTPMDDSHTAGLERLTGLRRLDLRGSRCGDATLGRIGHLTGLRHLDLVLGGPSDPDSLRALGRLRDLRTLHLVASRGDEAPRHLAGLDGLRELEIDLDGGPGEAVRDLAGLRSLRHLRLLGVGRPGVALRELERVKSLRTLQIGPPAASPTAARRLAAAIPGLTIRNHSRVVRAPRPTARFRRVILDGFASVLVPDRWTRLPRSREATLDWLEEGFEGLGHELSYGGSEPRAGQIALRIEDLPAPTDARAIVRQNAARSARSRHYRIEGPSARPDLASATYRADIDWALEAIATSGGRAAVLSCSAPRQRFPDLLGLFRFLAASLRAGPGSEETETVVVDARELA